MSILIKGMEMRKLLKGDCSKCTHKNLPTDSATCVECGLSRKNFKEENMKEIKNHIICGFPGVGKSQAAMRSREIQDIESNPFHMPIDWENIEHPEKMRHEENPNWVSDYVDHIADMASQYGYAYNLVSCHLDVRTEMDMRGIPYIIVVPGRDLKDEYLGRYLRRGDSFDFIYQIDTYWDEWLTEIDKCGMPVIHLKSGQYISDVLPVPRG